MKEFLKAVNKLALNCVVKVLNVNLNTGEYNLIHADKGEFTVNSPLLDDWVNTACDKLLVHPDYSEAFRKVFSVESISKTLKYKKYIHYKFLRQSNLNTNYRMSVITVLPIENNHCYLIVYDIDNN